MGALKLATLDFDYNPTDVNYGVFDYQTGSGDTTIVNQYTSGQLNPITAAATSGAVTFSAQVFDENMKPLPSANISVNEIATAQTSSVGSVTIPNLANTDVIKITYVGYKDVVFTVQNTPSYVSMEPADLILPGVVIPPKPSVKPPSNKINWFLVFLGVVVTYGGYKIFFDKSKGKVVYAKV